MTRPRRIVGGDVVIGTRRCSERRFFLRPDPTTNRIFEYCLARAARLTGVLLHEYQVLSNHYHIVFTDVRGERPRFFGELNALVARAVNREFAHWESFFAPGSYNAPRLVDGDAIEDKCLYTLCNVVEAGLVPSPEYWGGVCSWNLDYGETKSVSRPAGFFRDSMPERETLHLVRPSTLYPELSDTEARARLRQRAIARSHRTKERIRNSGGGFVGMRRVLRQPRNDSPRTRAPRRGIRPTVAGRNKWARIEALQTNVAFVSEHRSARLRYEAGVRAAIFPKGTYEMARRFGVTVSQS